MANIPSQEASVHLIEQGEFEQKFYMDRGTMAGFLRDLADQLEQGQQVEISTENWRTSIAPGEPIELEVEFEGKPHKKEIELEITFKQKATLSAGGGPKVR